MATPDPLAAPVKGAGTILLIYKGKEDATAKPLDDEGWVRLANIRELQPGEISADSYDNTWLDDNDADWKATAQGEKSAGEASITLAWKPGEQGQKDLLDWFYSGEVRFYKIRHKHGAVDLFKGWVSSLGKTIPAKEVITRTIKVMNSGKPKLAEEIPLPSKSEALSVISTE